ncbi:hypothetical protein M2137_001384 [Parabacteroides sp. PFB2-10]|uniref:DUF4221 family protein n=1 Tax=Parabacteroides sp. PFB2-10 TaxID=1742405 RepID=UPI002476ADE9|nr:DUF4221 family protein [Parabacteroides sp. PFB2-10]MDH6312609.1 hypothetical protein [Parabacteroides sp. PFB2-10]
MKKKYILLLAPLLICSCSTENNRDFILEESGESLLFELDRSTYPTIPTLSIVSDGGEEYLSIENRDCNQIIFYNLKNGNRDFTIDAEVSGSNGVGPFLGYYIHNLDSIFLTSIHTAEIPLIDRNANEIDKIQYEYSTNGLKLFKKQSLTSMVYHPLELIDNKLYVCVGANRHAERNPVSVSIDLETKEVRELNFYYPALPNVDNKNKRSSSEDYFSRCFNGENFIYSFHYDENIYITSVDHKEQRKIPVKSYYVDKISIPDDYDYTTDFRQGARNLCEGSYYGNLIYDKYRNVYYRIAYPKTSIESGVDAVSLIQFGKKNFSIIILDNEFDIIGETRFPDYRYNSYLLFVNKDGLYISSSHCMNPNYSDDVLSFVRFDLKRE